MMTPELNATAQARKRKLVDTLYRKYSRALGHFLGRQQLTGDEVADLVQETYCRVQRLPDVESIQSPRAFLFRIAHNLMRNSRKHQWVVLGRGTVDAASIDVAAEDPSAYRVLKGEQELAIVRSALAELSPKCRRIFLLNRFENLSYGEIAGELHISVSMIEKYVSQALAHMRIRLAEADEVSGLRRQRK